MHEYEAREVTSAGRPAPFSAPALFPVSRGRSKAYCPESHTNSCRMTSCRSARGRSFTLSTSFPTNGTWSRTLGARSVSSRPITCRKACRPRWKSSSLPRLCLPRLRPAHTSTNQGSHAPQHRQRMDRLQLLAVPHALSTGASNRHSCHIDAGFCVRACQRSRTSEIIMQMCVGENVAMTGRDVVVSLKSDIAGQRMHVRSLRAFGTLCHGGLCHQNLTGTNAVYYTGLQYPRALRSDTPSDFTFSSRKN
jgi:hypothetical protein